MESAQSAVRVRRGIAEVEISGSERFVKEMMTTLLETYLGGGGAADADAPDVEIIDEPVRSRGQLSAGLIQPQLFGMNPHFPTLAPSFRDMLNTAANPTAAEKVLLAGYYLMSEGREDFDATTAAELFTSAYENKPNFSRELERAAKAGWIMRTRGGDPRRLTFRLTHRGIAHVRTLVGVEEAV